MGLRVKARISLFVGLTCFATAPFWALGIATGDPTGGRGAYAVGSMWAPGLAALLTCWITGQSVNSLGWKWGRWRWQVLSYLWPLAVCSATYGRVYAFGLGGFPNLDTVNTLRVSLGWPTAGTWAAVSGWFVLFATTGFVRGVAASLGEEIGWRGFLAPILHYRLGFTGGALMTGALWAVWHFPIILFSNYNNATPWWFAIPCFVVEVMSLAVIMSWIRLRSGSLWTGALAHASINLFNQGFFVPLTSSCGAITAYAIDESGAVLPFVLSATAVFVWTKRHSLDDSQTAKVSADRGTWALPASA
ncbi:MAG: CPBP family intramembrane metalloprotease [Novosphingobium sp.]